MIAPAAPRRPETTAPPRMRFVRPLGEGGMGVVFVAERAVGDGLWQRVVVKRPRGEDGAPAARTLERFADEARALARVSHGNVVRLLDAGADASGPWIALEHVDGVDAHVLLEALRGGAESLSIEELAWLAHEAARGMAAAHGLCDEHGEPAPILHRDLSPQNLLLSRHGEVKVTDFGIAWAVDRSTRTTTGVVVGNLRYIAPEQLEGRAVGPTTDVYGVGRVVEELLEVTAPEGIDGLRAVAARATRRDPDERHPTMEALAEAIVEAVPTLARGAAALGRRVEAIQRSRAKVTSALAGLLAAERAHNDRVSVPASAPVALAERPATEATRVEAERAAVPAPSVETTRSSVVPARPTRRPLVAAAAALVVAGVAVGARRMGAEPPRARAAMGRPVIAAVATMTATPRAPEVTPEVPAPEVPAPTAPAPTVHPPEVVAPTRGAALRAMHHGGREVRAGSAMSDAAVAAPEPARATLRVSSIPYAVVSVDDGAPVGTPHAFELPPGQHRVRARFVRDGNVEVTRVVTLAPGERRPLGLTTEGASVREVEPERCHRPVENDRASENR